MAIKTNYSVEKLKEILRADFNAGHELTEEHCRTRIKEFAAVDPKFKEEEIDWFDDVLGTVTSLIMA